MWPLPPPPSSARDSSAPHTAHGALAGASYVHLAFHVTLEEPPQGLRAVVVLVQGLLAVVLLVGLVLRPAVALAHLPDELGAGPVDHQARLLVRVVVGQVRRPRLQRGTDQ